MDKNLSTPSTLTSSNPPTDSRSQLLDQLNKSNDGSLVSQITSNPLFTAGFGLAALAAAARLGQQGLRQGAALLKRRLLVDAEITHKDAAFPWLLQWMNANQRSQLAGGGLGETQGFVASVLRRFTPGIHHLQINTSRVIKPDGAQTTHISILPGPGRHILRYKNAFIAVSRQREKSFDIQTGIPFETVTMTTLYAHRNIFEDIFGEVNEMARMAQEGKTIMYTAWGTEWRPFGDPKRKRPLESVILEEGVKERIVEDIEGFLSARTWYLDRGIPYRRGYLLYGPPGTGKSSFIQALAGSLDFNIAILNVSERGLTDDKLNHLLTKVPQRTIVLLEDVDVAFMNRRTADPDGYSGATVTLSGLLNALDGVASGEERIVFLTTNHVERLDEALVRPGRVDMTVRLGEATEYQMEHLWDRFYSDVDTTGQGKVQFIKRAKELNLPGRVSTAALQGLFLYRKGDPGGAIAMLDELKVTEDAAVVNKV